jgi:hypothetical protein
VFCSTGEAKLNLVYLAIILFVLIVNNKPVKIYMIFLAVVLLHNVLCQ